MNDLLVELGWQKKDLAERLGLHQNTVYLWKNNPPKYAMAYLQKMVEIKRLLQ